MSLYQKALDYGREHKKPPRWQAETIGELYAEAIADIEASRQNLRRENEILFEAMVWLSSSGNEVAARALEQISELRGEDTYSGT